MTTTLTPPTGNAPSVSNTLQHLRWLCTWLVVAACTLAVASSHAQQQTFRMTAKDADIHEFVAQVADITGKTFVIDPRLKGSVTVISETPMDKDGVTLCS